MAEQDSREVDLDPVVRIVSRYVQHHQMAPDQLLTLIVEVHRALAGLGRATPVQQPPKPVVPVRPTTLAPRQDSSPSQTLNWVDRGITGGFVTATRTSTH